MAAGCPADTEGALPALGGDANAQPRRSSLLEWLHHIVEEAEQWPQQLGATVLAMTRALLQCAAAERPQGRCAAPALPLPTRCHVGPALPGRCSASCGCRPFPRLILARHPACAAAEHGPGCCARLACKARMALLTLSTPCLHPPPALLTSRPFVTTSLGPTPKTAGRPSCGQQSTPAAWSWCAWC